MTKALAHRGPDGEGIELMGGTGLCHRRLAIIDLAGGRQPISNEDGQVWVTFNGEIYNFRELRRQLIAHGHQFRTNSDTEVIVHGYEQWGERCVDRFRGMFAFALVSNPEQKIFLARDHLGIKPLYYLINDRCVAFGSELQSLRCVPGFPSELDLRAIDQYLCLQYIPAPKTAYRGVYKLPPGHSITFRFDGRTEGPREYWRVEFRPNHAWTEAEWLDRLDDVLRDSVRAHLVSDVPFGAFLSGGIDSSCVLAYMTQILNEPVRAFTIGFDEEEFSEVRYAEIAAGRWNASHRVEVVRADCLGLLPSLVKHYGEPFGDSSALPTYYLSRLARREVPMVLSGDGGDEAFGGYNDYSTWRRWINQDDQPAWKQRAFPNRPSLPSWLALKQQTTRSQRRALWRPEYRDVVDQPLETFERAFSAARGSTPAHIAQALDIHTYLPFSILTKVDTASMMHGLEVRTPLVDAKVFEFAATIPEDLSIARDGAGQFAGKLLLKKLLQRYYPEDFVHRPKMGFGVPLQRWFAPGGILHGEVRQRLSDPQSPLFALLRPEGVLEIVDSGNPNPIWLLVFLDEWLRQNPQRML